MYQGYGADGVYTLEGHKQGSQKEDDTLMWICPRNVGDQNRGGQGGLIGLGGGVKYSGWGYLPLEALNAHQQGTGCCHFLSDSVLSGLAERS